MPTGFFHLPRELRNIIYSLVWQDKQTEWQETTSYAGPYDHLLPWVHDFAILDTTSNQNWDCPCPQSFLLWTTTCKTFLDEAVDEFWHTRILLIGLDFCPNPQHLSRSLLPYHILSPTRARRIQIVMNMTDGGAAFAQYERQPAPHLDFPPTQGWYFRRLMQKLAEAGKTRSLSVIVGVNSTVVAANLAQSVRLKALVDMGLCAKHLDKLELFFHITKQGSNDYARQVYRVVEEPGLRVVAQIQSHDAALRVEKKLSHLYNYWRWEFCFTRRAA